jgi:hypothetical protein
MSVEHVVQDRVRLCRNGALRESDWRMARAKEQVQLGIVPDDDRTKLLIYRQFLRDFTKRTRWWEADVPTFEQWLKTGGSFTCLH